MSKSSGVSHTFAGINLQRSDRVLVLKQVSNVGISDESRHKGYLSDGDGDATRVQPAMKKLAPNSKSVWVGITMQTLCIEALASNTELCIRHSATDILILSSLHAVQKSTRTYTANKISHARHPTSPVISMTTKPRGSTRKIPVAKPLQLRVPSCTNTPSVLQNPSRLPLCL